VEPVKNGYIAEALGSIDMERSLVDLIATLQKEIKNHPNHKNLRIQWEYGYDGDDRYEELWGDRQATAEETAAWNKKQRDTKLEQEEWQRKQYEELRTKFEKK
jgi:hypothetical protein